MAFIGNAFRSVARFIAPAVGPVVGAITLNPVLAAGAAAATTAVAGGNRRQILSRATGAGLGTATGGSTALGGVLGRQALSAGASYAFSDTKAGQQLAPVVVAGVTGKPFLAAAAGAHSAVARGGGVRDAITGATLSGIGTWLGGKDPGRVGSLNLGAAKGALAGQFVGNAVNAVVSGSNSIRNLISDHAKLQSTRPAEQEHTSGFAEIRDTVERQTEQAFAENRSIVAGVTGRRIPLVNIYNRRFFEPLKDLARRSSNAK